MMPNLEEDAISGAVRIWDVVGSMEVGFIAFSIGLLSEESRFAYLFCV